MKLSSLEISPSHIYPIIFPLGFFFSQKFVADPISQFCRWRVLHFLAVYRCYQQHMQQNQHHYHWFFFRRSLEKRLWNPWPKSLSFCRNEPPLQRRSTLNELTVKGSNTQYSLNHSLRFMIGWKMQLQFYSYLLFYFLNKWNSWALVWFPYKLQIFLVNLSEENVPWGYVEGSSHFLIS